jgi:hypothetical protein
LRAIAKSRGLGLLPRKFSTALKARSIASRTILARRGRDTQKHWLPEGVNSKCRGQLWTENTGTVLRRVSKIGGRYPGYPYKNLRRPVLKVPARFEPSQPSQFCLYRSDAGPLAGARGVGLAFLGEPRRNWKSWPFFERAREATLSQVLRSPLRGPCLSAFA